MPTPPGHQARRPHRQDDTGSTLVVAIMVASVALLLGVVAIAQAVTVSRDSGEDRQRTAQVHAAEGGIDDIYHQLQAGTTPCTPTELNVLGSPDITTVQTTVVYLNSSGAAFNPCTSGASPVKALITATSTSANNVGGGTTSRRTMESQVLLSPASGGSGYAMYVDGYFSVPNGFELSGDGVSSPDIYARGGLGCSNSAGTDGSVFVATGGAQLANSCTIAGSLQARDQISMSNSARVGGDAYSSRGALILQNSASVGGNVTVYGNFQGSAAKVGGSVTAKNWTPPLLPDPIDQPMRYVGYEPGKWQTAGFSIDSLAGTTDCEGIKTRMFQATTPTVFQGNCAMNFSNNNNNLKLKTDVALFLAQGINISNNFSLASDDSDTTRKLWIISPAGIGPQPTGWSAAGCTGGGLNFSNQTDIDGSVNVFLYSCGGIQMANSTEFHGQVYGKQVTVSNSFEMTFVALPPAGLDLGGQPASPGYKVEVVYKRETQNP